MLKTYPYSTGYRTRYQSLWLYIPISWISGYF
jgi:hypothetical protein